MNELLTLLTNRNQGYVWGELQSPFYFRPRKDTGAAAAVRKILRLSQHGTDYFVLGALLTVASVPEYHALFSRETTYDLRHYQLPQDSVIGADLMPDKSGPPFIHRVPAEWPAVLSITVDYHTPQTIRVACGGQVEVVNFFTANEKLYFDWPAFTGVRGSLLPATSWSEGSHVEILHTPTGLPHEEILRQLNNLPSGYFLQLMQQNEMMDPYISSQNPQESLAAVVAALALATQKL